MARLSFLVNAPDRYYGITLFGAVVVYIAMGILTYALNTYMRAISLDPMVYDPIWLSLFTIVLAVFLFNTTDSEGAAMSKVSTIFVLGIVCVITAAANLLRLALVLFAGAYYAAQFGAPMGLQITSAFVIDIVSFLVVIKQSYRISRGESSSNQMNSLGVNKFALSIVMVINGIILFGLAAAVLQERWITYYSLAMHYHGVALFISGVIGIVADKKNFYEMNVWHKIWATFTFGISASGVIVLVQTVVYLAKDPQFSGSLRTDYAVITMLQGSCTLIGFLTSVVAFYACEYPSDTQLLSDDEQQKHTTSIDTKGNTGVLISCLLAAGMAIFAISLLAFPTYGYATLIVASMAFTSFQLGMQMNISSGGVMKQSYSATTLFTAVGSFYAIGLDVYGFLATQVRTSNITYRTFAYIYVFMGLSILSLFPLLYFAGRISYQHFRSKSFANDSSNPVSYSAKAVEDASVSIP